MGKVLQQIGFIESELIYKNGSLAEERYYDEKPIITWKINNIYCIVIKVVVLFQKGKMLYICTPFKNMVSEVKILSCSSSKDLAEKF